MKPGIGLVYFHWVIHVRFTYSALARLRQGWMGLLLLCCLAPVRAPGADGDLDPGFSSQAGFDAAVMRVLPWTNGRMLVGGEFSFACGVTQPKLAVLLSNGQLDTNFPSGFAWNSGGWIKALALQPDGKILIGGYFDQIYGVGQSGIARLNPDGSLDTSFHPPQAGTFFVNDIVVLGDGKILLAAQSDLGAVVRLNADGSRDAAFNFAPSLTWAHCLLAAGDGTIYAGGVIDLWPNGPTCGLVRLNSNGTAVGFAGMERGSFVTSMVRQPDGLLVIAGGFGAVNGSACNGIARLKPDWSLDPSFRPEGGPNGAVNGLVLQSDGKMVLAGEFTTFGSTSCGSLVRLNSDGSLDPTFNPGGSGADNWIEALTVMPDKKLVIGGHFGRVNGFARGGLARLTWDNPDAPGYICYTAGQYEIREDQTSAVITLKRSGGIQGKVSAEVRLGPGAATNGQDYQDPVATVIFAAGQTAGSVTIPLIDDQELEGDESIGLSLTNCIGGASLGTESTATLVIHDDDSAFQFSTASQQTNEVNPNFTVTVVRTGARVGTSTVDYTTVEGSALAGADYVHRSGTLTFTEGQAAQTFTVAVLDDPLLEWQEQFKAQLRNPTGKAILGGVSEQALTIVDNEPAGGLDVGFAAQSVTTVGNVNRMALLPDGSVIVPGVTNALNRILTNGVRDVNYPWSPILTVTALATQADGKLLVCVSTNAFSMLSLLRLLPDGTLDSSFCRTSSANSTVECILPLSDGKIAISGSFLGVNRVRRMRVARLLEDGQLDLTFDPSPGTATGPNDTVYCLAEGDDGKLVIGGAFTSVSGVARKYLARLNADGSLDTSFLSSVPPAWGANNVVRAVVREPDGDLLVAGHFTQFNTVMCSNLVRLKRDGALDNAFSVFAGVKRVGGNAVIFALARGPNGMVYVGGDFDSAGGLSRKCLARFGADGAPDPVFTPGEIIAPSFTTSRIDALAVQPDGKLLVGGNFRNFGSSPRFNLVRLNTETSLIPLRLSSVGVGQGGGVLVHFVAPLSGEYVLLASEDLREWQPVIANTLTAGEAELLDSRACSGCRFYRVSCTLP